MDIKKGCLPLLIVFFPFIIFAEENFSEEKDLDLEAEELWIQDTFPQYRMSFHHKSVQEKVYNEFLKEQEKEKEKEENNSSDKSD